MGLASSIVIAGRSLNATPESVFLGVVTIITGLRIWLQGSIWWHHLMDWIIGAFALSTVPQFGAQVSRVSTKSWAGYGVPVILLVVTVFMVFKLYKIFKKK